MIRTWADGYGIWHASVPGTPDQTEALARRAIRAELLERHNSNRLGRTRVRLVGHAEGRTEWVER